MIWHMSTTENRERVGELGLLFGTAILLAICTLSVLSINARFEVMALDRGRDYNFPLVYRARWASVALLPVWLS